MNFFSLSPAERTVFGLPRRTAKILIAVALCLVVTDIVLLLRTPFLNPMVLVALVISLALLGASLKLLMDERSEKSD